MEMPKGFHRVVRQGINSQWTQGVVGINPIDLVLTLALMREMAEALERAVDANSKGYAITLEQMEEALKKFRKWK